MAAIRITITATETTAILIREPLFQLGLADIMAASVFAVADTAADIAVETSESIQTTIPVHTCTARRILPTIFHSPPLSGF